MPLSEDINAKLKKVFHLFLSPDYNVVTTTYLDLLLTHIIGEINKGNQTILQDTQNWLITAVNSWNKDSKPCQNVSIFTIKLIGMMSVKETTFLNLSQNTVHDKACSIFQFQMDSLSPSVKMAFATMLSNLLEHQSGRQWIAYTGAWKEILKFAQLNHTLYLTRESYKFLSILLVKESNNRSLCELIILAITEPLVNLTINSQVDNLQVSLGKYHFFSSKDVLSDQNQLLVATLELLLAILEYTLFLDLENPIPDMFEELTNIESRVRTIFEVSISTPFMKTVHKLSKLINFIKLRIALRSSETIDEKVFEQFCLGLCFNNSMLLSKKYILDLVISNKLGIIYWKRLKKLKTFEVPPPYKFENQAIALMILPLCVTMKPTYMKEHYLFEEFVEKLFDVTCTPVQRLAYSIRDVILKNEFPLEYICKSTVDHLLEIIDIMDRETAVICFQVMCHALKNFVTESSQNSKQNEKPTGGPTETARSPPSYQRKKQQLHFLDGDPINDKQTLLAALLNGLNVMTEKFKLKWRECVETICLLAIAQDILNHPGVHSKICTLALKTCRLAIENLMPPNLALLSVEFDEQTSEIGPTLYKRLHDPNWEVRDSVFEILNTIAILSEHKYPPYQCLLLTNKFLQVAVDIASGDKESYVRASALTFISTTVRISTLWEKLLCQLNLPDLAIKLVYEESEAVVRREAVVLIKELYVNRKWQKCMISTMTKAMTIAAVLDLHWEVKVNALEFWRHFIKSHLTDQGMLDGHFPNVTFSKEHRKIVSLDETEIKQRLNKALDELSRQRCLGVLLVTLKDDSDFEVAKTSANIIADLRRVLLQYKIDEPEPASPSPKDSAIFDTNYKKRPPPSDLDTESPGNKAAVNIIDEIANADDTNLLASIYRETMKMDGEEMEKTSKEMLEYVGSIKRQTFLASILKFDLDTYLKQRSDWLQNYTSSFDSVLDDILIVSENKDINQMDCY
ncbi:hypothetical protein TSAR_013123 [Trichomalopsis sarcophagae]|uniref:BRCA1-associated ATM activator 1 n=1 Tax=Trichomalopsis sarcophagae TaxID=543379 RepID=A0A232F1Y9_9HYME|nr:hypothetical protein TSAR_013123 [Trichomalopsis sarcophagae]